MENEGVDFFIRELSDSLMQNFWSLFINIKVEMDRDKWVASNNNHTNIRQEKIFLLVSLVAKNLPELWSSPELLVEEPLFPCSYCPIRFPKRGKNSYLFYSSLSISWLCLLIYSKKMFIPSRKWFVLLFPFFYFFSSNFEA